MTEKQTIEETRLTRLDWWLRRQSLSPKFPAYLEAAEAFKARLKSWANSERSDLVAPSFHLASL